ncbi:hypothetical protein V4762_02675 [Thermodesulfobium sp. 4217-1]|uniref:hypothetical protein n=1 Tax=Thermodesulfobium sp. 4217-1 TaxID=3120013 RepID=UPI003221DA2A
MIEIYPNTKIYIAVPASIFTGGPELLHQLMFQLKNVLKIDNVFMYYYPLGSSDPIHPNFKIYNPTPIDFIEDSQNNLLIVPETSSLFINYSQIRKALWWLSVDNFYLNFIINSKINFFFPRLINKILKTIINHNIFDIVEIALNSKKFQRFVLPDYIETINYHLCQSFYAKEFIKKGGISQDKIYFLSDYLNSSFLSINTDLSQKDNLVAYNPKKGSSFTKKIISNSKDIKFIPLINMSRTQVISTLQKAKVYIDFGNHPGKDRIPREAAILGCCVITGKRGSAAFFEDVSIPDEYKFEDKDENIPKIISKMKDCLENFESIYKDFDLYREKIKDEPQKFIEDLKKIFVKVENDQPII